ncbi:MAG TPA: hypothetical protein PKE19_09040, partial [Aestuariivirga sp.]|nr:hypothetical protein [Aestuariivirga sp.]
AATMTPPESTSGSLAFDLSETTTGFAAPAAPDAAAMMAEPPTHSAPPDAHAGSAGQPFALQLDDEAEGPVPLLHTPAEEAEIPVLAVAPEADVAMVAEAPALVAPDEPASPDAAAEAPAPEAPDAPSPLDPAAEAPCTERLVDDLADEAPAVEPADRTGRLDASTEDSAEGDLSRLLQEALDALDACFHSHGPDAEPTP